jgi:hypothetical protein
MTNIILPIVLWTIATSLVLLIENIRVGYKSTLNNFNKKITLWAQNVALCVAAFISTFFCLYPDFNLLNFGKIPHEYLAVYFALYATLIIGGFIFGVIRKIQLAKNISLTKIYLFALVIISTPMVGNRLVGLIYFLFLTIVYYYVSRVYYRPKILHTWTIIKNKNIERKSIISIHKSDHDGLTAKILTAETTKNNLIDDLKKNHYGFEEQKVQRRIIEEKYKEEVQKLENEQATLLKDRNIELDRVKNIIMHASKRYNKYTFWRITLTCLFVIVSGLIGLLFFTNTETIFSLAGCYSFILSVGAVIISNVVLNYGGEKSLKKEEVEFLKYNQQFA